MKKIDSNVIGKKKRERPRTSWRNEVGEAIERTHLEKDENKNDWRKRLREGGQLCSIYILVKNVRVFKTN